MGRGKHHHREFSVKALSPILVLSLLCACAPRQVAKVVIPQRCAHVGITDFTRPCAKRKDGTMVCDKVIAHADCIEVQGSHE
jgi:hypothetical protein